MYIDIPFNQIKYIIMLVILSNLISKPILAQDIEQVIKEKPIALSGGLALGSFFNTSIGGDLRQPKLGYSVSARANLKVYGFNIPFSVHYNEQGSRFGKPFNRFGLTPNYKWLKLHLGWSSMSLSQFTLANTSFYGAGIELTPLKWHIAAMYGRFKQASDSKDSNYLNPQFERLGMAVKLGYGGADNFFDLMFFKAQDDTLSINVADNIYQQIDANENAIVGVKTKYSIIDSMLSIHFDGGLSAFTLNTRRPYIDSSDIKILNNISKIYKPNASSQLNYALETGLNFHYKGFSLATIYRKVMPEYKSLGADYIIDDLEAITINPSFTLLKQKLIFSGSIGIQRNNLNNFKQKNANKKIGSANIVYNPAPSFGLSMSYANYTFNQQVIKDVFFEDSLLIDQINHSFNFIPRYTHISSNTVQNVVLVLNYQLLDDRNQVTEYYADNKVLLANLNYNLTRIKSKLGFNIGFNYFDFNSNIAEIKRYGINVGTSKRFLNNKIYVSISTSVNSQSTNDDKSIVLTGFINGSYKIRKNLSLKLRSNMINNQNQKLNRIDIRSQISISLNF